MDFSEATRIVYNKIQKLESEHASKIIGFLLLQDHGEDEIIRLASEPESSILSLVSKAKSELGLSLRPATINPLSVSAVPISDQHLQYTPFTPVPCRPFSSQSTIRVPSPFWESQLGGDRPNAQNSDFLSAAYANLIGEGLHAQDQSQFVAVEDQLDTINSLGPEFSNNYYFPEQAMVGNLNIRSSRRTSTPPEYAVKACHYFNKGNCRHGTNCRFFHGQAVQDGYSQLINSSHVEIGSDDHLFLPGSLEKLEIELTELLMSRRGMPVSIASLPMLYFEKFGRNLQAEGYLTESQRHGKAGFSLTKLLTRLSNNIRVIDRPHGQHSVILAEDASRFLDYKYEKNDHGVIVAGSRQIYLTFPAESTFSEDDVSEYFSTYGPVQDVRIPSQQKRMFGFVTFMYAETVKQILAKGNPHYVCGARVLVKPYREKSRLDRKYTEKMDSSMYYPPHFFEVDNTRLHSGPRLYDNARLLRKQLIEDHEQALEFERRKISDFHLAAKPLSQQPYINYPVTEEAKLTDQSQLPSADRFGYLFDVLNNGSNNEEKGSIANSYSEQESSQGLNLPESPFASPIASGISTVI